MVFSKELPGKKFGVSKCPSCCEPFGTKRLATSDGSVTVNDHVCRVATNGKHHLVVETVVEGEECDDEMELLHFDSDCAAMNPGEPFMKKKVTGDDESDVEENPGEPFMEKKVTGDDQSDVEENATGVDVRECVHGSGSMRESRWTQWEVDDDENAAGSNDGGEYRTRFLYDVHRRLVTTYGSAVDADFEYAQNAGNRCWNCKRCSDDDGGGSPYYELHLDMYPRRHVRTKVKFSTLRANDLQNVDAVPFCRECASFMIFKDSATAENAWPAFIWKMLMNVELQRRHGASLWCFVPTRWRQWWIGIIHTSLVDDDVYESVTMEEPEPFFKEISADRDILKKSISKLVLSDLKKTVDKYMHATVRCPWGCTEFPHKMGQLDLSEVYRHYLGSALDVWSCSGKCCVRGTRDDYLTHIDHLLHNPAWRISPAIAFLENVGPAVMTCRDHTGGSNMEYIHPPINPNGAFPAARADQVAHAVVVPRTIRPMRENKFSNTFQMHQMSGCFSGIDTMDIVDRGSFNFQSRLSRDSERLSVAGRLDIRGLLARYAREGTIPEWLVEDYLKTSQTLDFPSSALGEGASYIPYADCVRLQKCLEDIDDIMVVTDHLPLHEQRQVMYTPVWPKEIVRTHRADRYGGEMYAVPSFSILNDARCMWYLFAMILGVPSLWRETAMSVRGTTDWPGWVLTTAASTCLPGRGFKAWKNSPFNKLGFDDLNKKLVLDEDELFDTSELNRILTSLRGVERVDASALDGPNFDFDSHCEIVVVTRSEVHGHVVLPTAIENGFELVFVGESTTGNTAGSWNGSYFVRHGGPSFPLWWRQKRRDAKPSKYGADLADEVISSWHVAVYVKSAGSVPTEEMKENYLQYIGGQAYNYCELHNVPFIPALKKHCEDKKCCCLHGTNSTKRCTRVPHLQCPVLGCPVVICRQHSKDASEKRCFTPWEGDVTLAEDEEPIVGHGDDVIENLDVLDDASLPDLLRGSILRTSEGWASVDSLPSRDSDRRDVPFEQDFYVLDGAEDDDLRDAYNVDHVDGGGGGLDDYFIPGTHAGRKTIPVWCAKSYISGHVILNNCGTCLIRKNRPLKPTRYQAAFLERMVATTEGYSVPLVYPEAMLFPSIFYKDTLDGSLLGAIPSALLTNDRMCHKQGFAGVKEHMRARLKNPSLLTGTDPRYIFHAFDCFTNLNLRGEDSRLVLSRGFIEDQGTGGVTANRSDMFNTDAIDSRPVVNNLAAAIREEDATYFYSQSCNQSGFFGVRPIKNWIDSAEFEILLQAHYKDLSVDDVQEILHSAQQAACVPLVRNWMEVSEIYMHYIAKSPEEPVGKVKKIWWRHEYQDSAGNLSHIHALIWTEDDDLDIVLDRIRGSVAELIRSDEVAGLIAEGIIERFEDVLLIRDAARYIQFHSHNRRCLRRVGPGLDDFQCKVPSAVRESPCPSKHSFKTIEPRHCDAALEVLAELGLCDETSTYDSFLPLDERFRNEKHFAPALAGEGIMSPTNGRLFAGTESQSNLQYCTAYYSSRYLAKYVAGIDENNVVYVNAGTEYSDEAKKKGPRDESYFAMKQNSESPQLVMDSHFLHNTKIESSKKNEAIAHKKLRNKNYPTGRAISITEACSLLLGYSQVYTNLEFVNISTVSLEKRPGSDREKPIAKLGVQARTRNDISADLITSFRLREQHDPRLPLWRRLLQSEQVILMDQLFSPVSVDKTTVFGARPPELRFVRQQGLYFRWFQRTRGINNEAKAAEFYERNLTGRVETTTWIDGLNYIVKLRPEAFEEIWKYVNVNFRRIPREVSAFFAKMERWLSSPPRVAQECTEWVEIQGRFFCRANPDNLLPIVVYSNIKPSQPQSFLIHVLLSMGEFVNEFELFTCQDIKGAFVNAGLLDLNDVQGSIRAVLHQYLTEQLVYMPGGTPMFDRLCVEAATILKQAFVTGDIPINEVPAALYTALKKDTTEKTDGYLKSNRERLANVTVDRIRGSNIAHRDFPQAACFIEATKSEPMREELTVTRGLGQTIESYEEQRHGFSVASDLLNQYEAAGMLMVKSLCIVGGPGCGKTFLMGLVQLDAMARGLNVMTTALMSERAQVLGGIHLHKVFDIPVRDATTVQRSAELALHSIYGNAELMAMLQTLDVLCIDELGQLSAGTISCLDIILRRLRGSMQFFGGILVISTMDPRQLKPIKGLPVMLSPSMLTSFKFIRLNHSVRAGGDASLRRIQDISRLPPSLITADVEEEFRTLIGERCVFVPEFDDERICSTMLRVFGTHDAVRAAEKALLAKVQSESSAFVECPCQDWQMASNSHSSWIPATPATSKGLTSEIKDAEVVYFFPGAIYEMTHNNKQLGYSQSQVAVLGEMPSRGHTQSFGDVALYIAPEGCKIVPVGVDIVCNPSALAAHGWRLCHVGIAPDKIQTVRRGMKAKRNQYAFKQRIASTVHAVMGSDVLKLVTKVSLQDARYRLWEKEQVVVLLSRTSYARDIIFVGSQKDTLDALVQLIKTRTQYCEYVTHLLNVLCGETSPSAPMAPIITIRQKFHPFRPMDVGLPQETSGYCYILVSLKDSYTTYIGQTKDLLKRIRQHNSGYGSNQTASPTLRPWALLAYVCGFDGNRSFMKRFEAEWEVKRDLHFHNRQRLSPCQVADLAQSVMANWIASSRVGLDLRYVQTGTFQLEEGEVNGVDEGSGTDLEGR